MQKIQIQYLNTEVGKLILGSFADKLCLCDWQYRKMRKTIDHKIQVSLGANYEEQNNDLLEEVKIQVKQYFTKERQIFELPLEMIGTEFQQQVWRELLNIPFGTTETYVGLSQKIGNSKAIRAVASANALNAISIIIPCHRIIGSDGSLRGYAGGIEAKKQLLILEKSQTTNTQLDIFS